MKKTLLLALGVFALGSIQAQQAAPVSAGKIKFNPAVPQAKAIIANKAAVKSVNTAAQNEVLVPLRAGNPYTAAPKALNTTGIEIGKTVYDLQTNSSIQNRIKYHGNGKVSAIWTFGEDDPNFPERGEAFNYRADNNSEFINNPGYSTIGNITAIENVRSGFGSIDRVAGKGDFVIAHNVDGKMQKTENNIVGDQGTWASTAIDLLDSLFWPRMVIGGPDGRTVHLIALTTPTSGTPAGLPFKGIDGALVYNRSTDGGQTWDKVKVLLPGIDSTLFKRFGGDGYAIDVRGNTVAFTCGDLSHEWFMMKSTDNGDTWTKTTILPFPIPNYDMETMISDIDGDQVADTIDNSDGSVAIVIDNNNKAHVFSGFGRMLNDALESPATYSYFPGQNGILYWNEDSINPTIISGIPDLDGDGSLNIAANFANYSCALASYPSAGIDNANNLYLTFGGAVETDNDGTGNYIYDDGTVQINYRHVFAIKSTDGGSTWSGQQDLTDFDVLTEYMYASLARDVDDSIRIVYQEDPIPGCAVNWSNATAPDYEHSFGENSIKYLGFSANLITGVKEQVSNFSGVKLFPNPADNAAQLTFTLAKAANVSATVINTLGQKVASVNGGNMGAGNHTVGLNVSNLASGIYFINLQTGNDVITQKLIVK